MATDEDVIEPLAEAGATSMRLLVLEMTVAAIVARLPRADFEEVVSMLVFIAKSSEATRDLENLPADAPRLDDARRYATAMLDRIAKSRRAERTPGCH
ncbi:MAG TPA: hypothetical protein VIL69_16975 [Roseomonas sp.]|jgi:hypothetical protein